MRSPSNIRGRVISAQVFAIWALMIWLIGVVSAHPLGQLSINHYVRITSGVDRVGVRYVVDMAELPTYQESQTIDADRNGEISRPELMAYLERVAPNYIANLDLVADGNRVNLQLTAKTIDLLMETSRSGSMGLATLRMVFDLAGKWKSSNGVPLFRFEDKNQVNHAGWRELVVKPMSGVSIYNSSAYGNGISDELKAYPEEMANAPPNERTGEWNATREAVPDGAKPLTARDGTAVVITRDRSAELISATELTPDLMLLDIVLCHQTLTQAGTTVAEWWRQKLETTTTLSAVGLLILGLMIGLRHALDTDHLAAISTIISERKNFLSALLIGGVWGVGHTASLLLAGIGVILLRIQIEKYEKPLEFCVALMLVGLGANVLYKLARGGKIHLHEHKHGEHSHFHPHIHGVEQEPESSHHGLRLSIRPLMIGMVHGLAGSAALVLAVLAKIKSVPLQFAYIGIFGIGSICGMIMMSLIMSLPIRLTANHFVRTNRAMRALTGVFSLGFGLFMVYEIGFVEGFLW